MKKYTHLVSLSLIFLIATPLITFAELNGIKGFIQDIRYIVKQLIVIMGGLALLGFFYGLAKFIFAAGDPKSHEQGRSIMIWGILALFVMVSVLGIINFFQNEFGLPQTTNGVDGGSINQGSPLPSPSFGDQRSA